MEINTLPEDMVGEIYSFVPITTLYILNKELFLKHYPTIIKNFILKNSTFQSYMRIIVRYDCNMQMELLLKENFTKWNKQASWKYKYNTFPSYIFFLQLLCIKYNSGKCKNIINKYFESTNSNKKIPKKIRSKNIKWSN